MHSFKSYRGILENTPPATNTPELDKSAEIDKIVDDWVTKLISDLINAGSDSKRGIWDRFKGSASNLWYGRNNQDNPYFYKNKFGDELGSVQPNESFIPKPYKLEDYRQLRDICNNLEQQINENTENLRIVQLIKKAAQDLKLSLKKIVGIPATASPVTSPEETPPEASPIAPDASSASAASETPPSEVPPSSAAVPAAIPDAKDAAIAANTDNASGPSAVSAGDNSMGGHTIPITHNTQPALDPTNPAFFTTPPTNGVSWEGLSKDDVKNWNLYGGGLEGSIGGHCFRFTKGKPITSLPYILRKGDPRIEILQSQEKEGEESFNRKFLDKAAVAASRYAQSKPGYDVEGHCAKVHAQVWRNLVKSKRVEEDPNFGPPIKDEKDLMDRISQIKTDILTRPKKVPAIDAAQPTPATAPSHPSDTSHSNITQPVNKTADVTNNNANWSQASSPTKPQLQPVEKIPEKIPETPSNNQSVKVDLKQYGTRWWAMADLPNGQKITRSDEDKETARRLAQEDITAAGYKIEEEPKEEPTSHPTTHTALSTPAHKISDEDKEKEETPLQSLDQNVSQMDAKAKDEKKSSMKADLDRFAQTHRAFKGEKGMDRYIALADKIKNAESPEDLDHIEKTLKKYDPNGAIEENWNIISYYKNKLRMLNSRV
jgi:hypothetical protein